VKLRFRVIQVGWEVDLDDNRHPRIRIGRRDWSAVLYDHPAEGWQVIALEVARKAKHGTRIETYDDATAASEFEALVGGESVFDMALNVIANDLYEMGHHGAAKRWVGKTLTLPVCAGRKVHSTKGEQ